jgi:hypothetical protein
MESTRAESVNPTRIVCSEAPKLKAGNSIEEKRRNAVLKTMDNTTFTGIYQVNMIDIIRLAITLNRILVSRGQ